MASLPRPEYPRPQFERSQWLNLNGTWSYEFDFGRSGIERGLASSKGFPAQITVPFCPESKLSGVAHTDFIDAMFYHRKISIPAEWTAKRTILHFGAVDYECSVFIDGKFIGVHYGGSTSFEFDITESVKDGKEHDLVLSVVDHLRESFQSSGKQSFSYESCGCCYTRVTGIWQTVWMEPVDQASILSCNIMPDLDNGSFHIEPLFRSCGKNLRFKVEFFAAGKSAGSAECIVAPGAALTVPLSDIRTWSPESPFLYDIKMTVSDASGAVLDSVSSYAGLRKIHCEGNKVFLNNKEIFLRLVLDQGFYPEGIWTAPDDASLKRDIELSMAAGFNGARLHQKVFEERYHYWADKLGYLTWGESASWGVNFFNGTGPEAMVYWKSAYHFMAEWRAIVLRDRNHPSIIAWTPANETWNLHNPATYRQLITEMVDLTKSLDPFRPVNDCSGYHHVKTDLWTVHLYMPDAKTLEKEMHPADLPVHMQNPKVETAYAGQPYINDEFGGFLFIPADRRDNSVPHWGYNGIDIKDEDEFCARIDEQVEAMLNMPDVSGYCYTQLTDVEQEQNGVYCYDRTPKASMEKLVKVFGRNPARLSK